MTTKTRKIVSLTAVVFLAGWYVAHASPLLVYEYTFDSTVEGWSADSGDLSWSDDQINSDGGYLEIDFDSGGINDWLRQDNLGLPGGIPEDWRTMDGTVVPTDIIGATIRFDFYAETATGYPATLMPYFTTDDGFDEHTWMLDMTSEVQATMDDGQDDIWYTFTADAFFMSPGNWTSTTGGTLSDWQNSFDSVTEVGFYLVHTTGDDLYAFDNIGLLMIVPEPGAMMLLGSALFSMMFTFRKKIGVRARELLKS